MIRTAFGQRRKTLANALAGVYTKEKAAAAMEAAGLSASARAEQLTLEQFACLADQLAE